jgi:2-polyprenyl-3-methyl-5-hydroxy-6-metoxy-1,4-benzoquinol methylase
MIDSLFNHGFICPECYSGIQANKCACGWVGHHTEKVFVALNNKDQKSEIFKKYLNNYDLIASNDLESSIQDSDYLHIQTNKFYQYLKKIGIQNKELLEIGVGQGLLVKRILKQNPISYFAIDISLQYLQNLETDNRLIPIMANAENIPFKHRFDLVIATDVMEHVLNVGDFLLSLNRCTKPGGRVAIRVPLLEDLIQYSVRNGCPYDFVHLRTYNRETLVHSLECAGFKEIETHKDGYQVYKLRSFVRLSRKIESYAIKALITLFGSEAKVAKINNFLGSLLMEPMEITIIAKKIKDL